MRFEYLPILLGVSSVTSKTFSTSVYGRVMCNRKPASNVYLRLYDKNLLVDKRIYETQTNNNGEFRLFGTVNTYFTFTPYVKLYHRCNYNGFCTKEQQFDVPIQFVTQAAIPTSTFDKGVIDLSSPVVNETMHCSQRLR